MEKANKMTHNAVKIIGILFIANQRGQIAPAASNSILHVKVLNIIMSFSLSN